MDLILNKARRNFLSSEIKKVIYDNLDFKKCALLLSDGIDSKSLLFSCIEKEIEVKVYSFSLEGLESTDFKGARKICEEMNIEFQRITIPFNKEELLQDLNFLIKNYGLKGKTNVECSWVMYRCLKEIDEDIILTGHGCDGHFGLSKKAMLYYKHSRELMNEFRDKLFSNENYAQKKFIKEFSEDVNKKVVMPFLDQRVVEIFKNTSWEEINKPKQKQVIIDMQSEYFNKIKIKKHSNFQLGDSGISEMFKTILLKDKEVNKRFSKNTVAIYNDIYKGVYDNEFGKK